MRDFLSYIHNYAREYYTKVFFVFFGALLTGIATGLTAYIIKPILDDLFISKNEKMLYIIPLMIIVIYSAKGIGRFMQGYYSAFVAGKITNNIRVDFLKHLIYLDLGTFSKLGSGQVVGKLISDVDKIKAFLLTNVASFIRSIVTIIFMIALIIYHSPKLAFFALFVLPLMIYPLVIFAKKMKQHSRASQDKISLVIHKMNEILNNFEVIKSFIAEKLEVLSFKNKSEEYFSFYMKAEKTNALIGPVMEVGSSIAVGLTIIIGGQEVLNDNMSVGSFFSFITALIMLYEPIKRLSFDYNRLQECIASYDRLQDIFNIKSKIKNGKKILNEKITNISFNNISLFYDKLQALKNINTTINENDTVALIGNSGGGKSSFANLISRFYDVSSGEILINNENIKNFDEKSLRAKISLVSQRTFIFNDTIANNITYSQAYNKDRLDNAIKKAHADFIYKFDLGTDTILDEFGSNVSGGQRQRIAIARAIYKEPDVYIFDEATSALDNESELYIKQSIEEIAKDKIVILIAHRISSIEYANKVLLFNNGEIIASGDNNEIKKHLAYKQLVGEALL